MQKQLRINKTPKMESILFALKAKKYPLMEENEIVKYLLSREFSHMLKAQSLPTQRTAEEKKEIQHVLEGIYQRAAKQKLGKKWLAKKGYTSENVTEEQFLDSLYEADAEDNT